MRLARRRVVRRAPTPRQRPRRRPSYFVYEGFDLGAELRRLCRLEAFGGPAGSLATDPPELTVRRASKRPRNRMGFAVLDQRRISVTAFPGVRRGDLAETLLHELVHIHVGAAPGSRRFHGREFKDTLERAMREAYDLAPVRPRHSMHGVYADAIERRWAAAEAA
ncbi:hypothetical protein HJD18_14235 [Thermoleophilia bacterium SCSIO 60948]|nr:hypothetical protein HJD18_14235 [Thermoleophilia bacterium SCSIO 60948]